MSSPLDLIGYAPTVGSAIYNQLQNENNMALQYQYSRDLAAYQNQANINMWRMNNEYNSPLQQMKRLKDAGLNPQLAYVNQPQSDAPAMVGGSTPTSQLSPLSGTDLANAALLRSQKENLDADTLVKRADALNKDTDTTIRRWQLQQDKMWQDFERAANVDVLKQHGLSLAIGNWLNGAVPHDADDEQSQNDFADIYRGMKAQIDDFRNNLKDEWKLTNYDRRYMDACFQSIVTNDKEGFEYNLKRLRSTSAVLKALGQNEWMQFVDYFTDKLMNIARTSVGAYTSLRKK